MTTPYMEIHCRKIWHVVRAYHRCTLLAVPSESLAECVGSVLADVVGKGSKPRDVESFIRQATIRLAGLRGHGGEEGVLSDALNFHYEGRDPSCWRFLCRSASGDQQRLASGRTRQSIVAQRLNLQRAITLQHCKPWVELPLLDVVQRRDLVLCKIIPRPLSFYGSASFP